MSSYKDGLCCRVRWESKAAGIVSMNYYAQLSSGGRGLNGQAGSVDDSLTWPALLAARHFLARAAWQDAPLHSPSGRNTACEACRTAHTTQWVFWFAGVISPVSGGCVSCARKLGASGGEKRSAR